MDRTKQNLNEAEEANQKMGAKFKAYNERILIAANTEIESTNQKIQNSFYDNNEETNYIPYHIDSNSPPIKK